MGQLESEAQKFSTKADIIGNSMYHNEYLELGNVKDYIFKRFNRGSSGSPKVETTKMEILNFLWLI